MRIKYDLSELGAASRERIEAGLTQAKILFLIDGDSLSVHKSDEGKVDEIIAKTEQIEDFYEATQSEVRAVQQGSTSRSCEICGSRPAAS